MEAAIAMSALVSLAMSSAPQMLLARIQSPANKTLPRIAAKLWLDQRSPFVSNTRPVRVITIDILLSRRL